MTRNASEAEPPRFSVIIPTCDREEMLEECLRRLGPGVQRLPFHEYEVIVSDDGSSSRSLQRLRESFPWAQWSAGPKSGPAANRNHGASRAVGDWLVFVDDDCLPDPGWLQAFADSVVPGTRALEGAIHPIGDPSKDLAECPENLHGGLFWSANVAVERALFRALGGFDGGYALPAHEDQDLYLRIRRITHVPFVPSAVVEHRVRIVPLRQAILRIPARSRAWALHLRKNYRELGYRSRGAAVIGGYETQLRELMSRLKRGHFRGASVALVTLTLGMPLIMFYLAVGEHRLAR